MPLLISLWWGYLLYTVSTRWAIGKTKDYSRKHFCYKETSSNERAIHAQLSFMLHLNAIFLILLNNQTSYDPTKKAWIKNLDWKGWMKQQQQKKWRRLFQHIADNVFDILQLRFPLIQLINFRENPKKMLYFHRFSFTHKYQNWNNSEKCAIPSHRFDYWFALFTGRIRNELSKSTNSWLYSIWFYLINHVFSVWVKTL